MSKKVLVLGALFALCWSTALASVQPGWATVDINKDGKPEQVAVTNLQDIAFNDRGEVVGWYEKLQKGTDFKADYGNKASFSLTGIPSAAVVLPGTAATATPPVTRIDPKTEVLTAVFKYSQGDATIEKTYTIQPRKLTVTLQLNVSGVSNYSLEWRGLGGNPKADARALEAGATQPLLNSGEVKNAQYASLQCCNSFIGGQGQAFIISPQAGSRFGTKLETRTLVRTTDKGTENLETSVLSLTLPGGVSKLDVYGGFNELVRLNQEGFYKFPGVFQPNVFGQLSLAIVRLLEWLHSFVNNWGLTIILLTVLVRLAMIPLLQTQYRSTAEMQAIQPLIKELQAKYKEDPQKQQQETMKLYQEHGVNPFAGCLPLLIQMPVLIVLWRVFSNYEFGESFLWLRDLSLPDGFYVLPVLYLASSMLQLWLSTRSNPEMFRQQVIVQFLFAYIFLSFPAGVTLYGVIGNLLAVTQQYVITQRTQAYMAARGKPMTLNAKIVPPPPAASSTKKAK